MATINISLPTQLKNDAEALVKEGLYVSFSDVVRDSLRKLIDSARYDLMYRQAKRDIKNGKATILKTSGDVDKFMKSVK